MSEQSTLPGYHVTDPQPADADRIQDQIEIRAQRLAARFPKAVRLEALVLDGMASALRGTAAAHAGTHAPEHVREMLRGERSMPLGDLCRLATTPTREAREAVRAVLAVLTRALDEHAAPAGTIAGRSADAALAATSLLGLVAKAQEDGRLDEDERAALRRAAVPLQSAVAAVEKLLHAEGK